MTDKRKKLLRSLSSKLGVKHQGAVNVLRRSARLARTREQIDHLRSFIEMPSGMVTVTMKDGRQLVGVVSGEKHHNEAGGSYGAVMIIDAVEGRDHELNLLDVASVVQAPPTDNMLAILRARGMIREDSGAPALRVGDVFELAFDGRAGRAPAGTRPAGVGQLRVMRPVTINGNRLGTGTLMNTLSAVGGVSGQWILDHLGHEVPSGWSVG